MSWPPVRTWYRTCAPVGFTNGRHRRDTEASNVVPPPHLVGSLRREELATRVGPAILDGTADVQHARRHEREQLVLVHGHR